MTNKLYDSDAYLKEFDATVISCQKTESGFNVVLDQTLFFPEEGGQTPDKGTINGINVLDVQISKDGVITHTLADKISEGESVHGKIDWSHRFSNMQQHTGEHIFSGLVNSTFGYNNVGFHLSDNIVTMDYDGVLTEKDVAELEYRANLIIASNIPVDCRYPEKDELANLNYRSKIELEGDVRIITIPGVDTCACCAPHVRSTAEVGILKIISLQNYKGGVRLSLLCGLRAFNDYTNKHNSIMEACHLLSSKPDELVDFVNKNLHTIGELKGELSDAKRILLKNELTKIDADKENIILFVEGMDTNLIRNTVNEEMNSRSGFVIIFNGNNENGYNYIAGSKNLDVREIGNLLREKLNAKGGGKENMIQGSVPATKDAITEILS